MRYCLFLLTLSLLILFGSNTQAGRKSAHPRTAPFTITGKIINTDPAQPNLTIRFLFANVFSHRDCTAQANRNILLLNREKPDRPYIYDPCRTEIPSAPKVEEQFAGQDIVFLYLCAPVAEKLWHSTLTELRLSGEQILLTSDQYNVLSETFGITGIPHDSIVDKQGNIAIKDTYRPSFDNKATTADLRSLQ